MAEDWDDDVETAPAQWLTLIEAMDVLVTTHSLSTAAAKDSILDLIADGRLKLRCQKAFEEADDGPINLGYRGKVRVRLPVSDKKSPAQTNTSHRSKLGRPKGLPHSYWLRSEGWAIEPARVDWPSGTLIGVRRCDQQRDSLEIARSQMIRRVASEVEILRDASIFPMPHQDVKTSEVQLAEAPIFRKTRVGRKKSDLWSVWFAEVIIDVELNKLDLTISAQDYHDLICLRISQRDRNQECLEYEAVAKTLSAIRNRWREEVNAGRIKPT